MSRSDGNRPSPALVQRSAEAGVDSEPVLSVDQLGNKAATGGAITLSGQVAKVVIQSASIVVLARLVSPQDFGLVVMVVAVVGVGEVLRDLGLSVAAVQAKSLSIAQRDNLFWLNSAIGLVLSVAVFLLARPIANAYGDDRLVEITQILSVTFFTNGLATQYRAQLSRHMRFLALAANDVISQLAALVVAVSLAALGVGYWALVWQQVTQVVFGALFAFCCGPWLPKWPNRSASIRSMIKIGGPLAGTQLLGYASRNIDSLVIGLRFGATSVGIYSKAFQVLMMPLNQINAPATTVALPVLSRLQDDRARYSRFLLRGQTVMTNVTGLLLALGIAVADPLLTMVLGDQWSGVASIFQILAIAGLFQVASYATFWVFLSLGLTASNFRFALASRPLMMAMILGGSQFGMVGVASAYSLSVGCVWLWGLWWVRRVPAVPVRAMLVNGIRCVLVYSAAGFLGWAVTLMTWAWTDAIRVALGAVAMGLVLVAAYLSVESYRNDIRSVTVVLRSSAPFLGQKGRTK